MSTTEAAKKIVGGGGRGSRASCHNKEAHFINMSRRPPQLSPGAAQPNADERRANDGKKGRGQEKMRKEEGKIRESEARGVALKGLRWVAGGGRQGGCVERGEENLRRTDLTARSRAHRVALWNFIERGGWVGGYLRLFNVCESRFHGDVRYFALRQRVDGGRISSSDPERKRDAATDSFER